MRELYSRIPIVGALVCCGLFSSLAVSPALAQRESGPFSGLFGGNQDSQSKRSLDVSGALQGAYEDSSRSDGPSAPVDPQFQRSGAAMGLDVGLAFGRRADHWNLHASGGGLLRDTTTQRTPVATAYNANVSLSSNLGRKVVFATSGAFSTTPYYQLLPSPDLRDPGPSALASGYGLATIGQRTQAISGSVSLSSNYSARSSVSVDASWSRSRLLDSTGGADSLQGRGTFRHQLTRTLGFHAGYGRQLSTHLAAARPQLTSHIIDLGLDFGDGLKFGRRTSLSFGSGVSVVDQVGQTKYVVNGQAVLTRGLLRTWSASLSYNRGVQFVAAFEQPVLSDAVSTSLGGQLATRVQWNSGLSFVRGQIGLTGPASYYSYGGSATLSVAITRMLSTFGEYTYSHFDAPAGTSVLALPTRFSRQQGIFGLKAWLPLMSDGRQRRDPR